MKKYCRYCAFCSYGDILYCVKKQMTMSEEKIKRLNNCKYFIFNEMDVLNPEHIYKPRIKKNETNKSYVQISLDLKERRLNNK